MTKKWNRIHYLKRVQHIQEIYQKHTDYGLKSGEIYKRYIYPVYFISRSTFYQYLTIPVKKLLKEFETENNETEQTPKNTPKTTDLRDWKHT